MNEPALAGGRGLWVRGEITEAKRRHDEEVRIAQSGLIDKFEAIIATQNVIQKFVLGSTLATLQSRLVEIERLISESPGNRFLITEKRTVEREITAVHRDRRGIAN